MVDKFPEGIRSNIMSRIRSKNTTPEKTIKMELRLHGFIYQPKVFGRPDFIDKDSKTVIFIDGCFWHKCPKHFKYPKSNKEYWNPKIERNILRDKEINISYKNAGWKVIRIWGHEIK